MSERVNGIWHKSPAVSNDPKMILASAAEQALIKNVEPTDQAAIAGFIVVLAYKDGTVSSMGAHLSKGDSIRALQYALFEAGATKIGKRSELD